jgi:hypothetical protein
MPYAIWGWGLGNHGLLIHVIKCNCCDIFTQGHTGTATVSLAQLYCLSHPCHHIQKFHHTLHNSGDTGLYFHSLMPPQSHRDYDATLYQCHTGHRGALTCSLRMPLQQYCPCSHPESSSQHDHKEGKHLGSLPPQGEAHSCFQTKV